MIINEYEEDTGWDGSPAVIVFVWWTQGRSYGGGGFTSRFSTIVSSTARRVLRRILSSSPQLPQT